ncbi:NAD-dependent epimerase/dehydratase family protein [Acinetobacter baumannii]
MPPTVFGVGLGPFAANRMSIQIPRLVYHSLVRRQVMTVGTGDNIWPNVHVADLAELYLLIMDAAQTVLHQVASKASITQLPNISTGNRSLSELLKSLINRSSYRHL